MTQSASGSSGSPALARTLGLWAIVFLGLGYMTPTVVFDTFGIVSDETGGVVPTAYVFALVVMAFTAVSYGRMTTVFPSAGSAYTYTSATISPNFGFLIGWAALLDYLLIQAPALGDFHAGVGLGMSDVLFLSLFVVGGYVNDLRVKAGFAAMVISFPVSVLLAVSVRSAVPALPLLCLSFVLVNVDLIFRRSSPV